jgi:DNA polymerase III alpha subunit
LNRPGVRKRSEEIIVKKNEQLKNVIKQKNKLSNHSNLSEILEETYGFIVFEEQISQILSFFFNCSFAEAEVIRQEITKKD